MSTITQFLASYWWLIALVFAVLLHKPILRLFFGMVIIPENKIGLVTKKFVLIGNTPLPDGRIIALNGEAGFQGKTLAPGLYWGKWPWQFEITLQDFTVIPEGSIGLLVARDGAPLPIGAILARGVECDSFQDVAKFFENGGQKGKQTAFIAAGSYRLNTYLFEIHTVPSVVVEEAMVGIVTAHDGAPLDNGHIAGQEVLGHNNFQNFDEFLRKGGNRGLQTQVILAGTYNLNPWAVTVEPIRMTEIPVAHVGVVISFVGKDGVDTSGEKFKHGNIVSKGEKGVWKETLQPGRYPVNTYTTKIELVPTANLVLNWATGRNESHKLDSNLSTIKVRSRDGFEFSLDVSQIIHVPYTEAPAVIARFGDMKNLVSQVLEPTIGNYFRNSGQSADVLDFIQDRATRQKEAKEHINKHLSEYNVEGVDTLIGDIVPPEAIMKTLSDRKIALEKEATFTAQKKTEEKRQEFEKAKSIADMQPEIVKANQNVEIAEKHADAEVKKAKGAATTVELNAEAQAKAVRVKASAEAEQITLVAAARAQETTVTGDAIASKTLAIGKAEAEAYKLQVAAMGEQNFASLKMIEKIADGDIKLIPEVLIGGGSNGDNANSMIGLMMLQHLTGGGLSNIDLKNFKKPEPQLLVENKNTGTQNNSGAQPGQKK